MERRASESITKWMLDEREKPTFRYLLSRCKNSFKLVFFIDLRSMAPYLLNI